MLALRSSSPIGSVAINVSLDSVVGHRPDTAGFVHHGEPEWRFGHWQSCWQEYNKSVHAPFECQAREIIHCFLTTYAQWNARPTRVVGLFEG